jgi:hypothetical protein
MQAQVAGFMASDGTAITISDTSMIAEIKGFLTPSLQERPLGRFKGSFNSKAKKTISIPMCLHYISILFTYRIKGPESSPENVTCYSN